VGRRDPRRRNRAIGAAPTHGTSRRRAAIHRVGLAAALALGCQGARDAGETAAFRLNPFGATEVGVVSREARGPYLLVHVRGRQLDLRFAVPATAECGRVLEPDRTVRYEKSGSFGRFVRDGDGCDAVGSLSLAAWRDRQPRGRTPAGALLPRSSARYTVVQRYEDLILLRGRFALASRVGVPAAHDLVAVVGTSPPCQAAAARGEASLEFRPAGPVPFRLLAGGERCPVEGFAKPVVIGPGVSAPAR
jgi:hypothetical protein